MSLILDRFCAVTLEALQRYLGYELHQDNMDYTVIDMLKQKKFHDIPISFVYSRQVLMVEFLISGLRVFDLVPETLSTAFAGGIGLDEVSFDMIVASVWFLENEATATQYKGALRRWKRVSVVGTTDVKEFGSSIPATARAIRYGQYEFQSSIPIVTETLTIGLVLKTMIQDGRPVIFYCRDDYGKIYQAAMDHYDIVGEVVPTDKLGLFSDIYFNICGSSFPFLSQSEKILCVEKQIPTLDGTVSTGLRLPTDNGLAARGMLARLDDYRTTMQVTELERFNRLAIERVIKTEKPQSLCFPGDGNGVGFKVAAEHNIPCVSGDLYPRHPGVVAEDWKQTIERSGLNTLVVFSRLIQFIEYDERVLNGRRAINIDRHHIKGWYRGLDALVSANQIVPTLEIKLQDRNTPLPLAEIPHFINYYRPHYDLEVTDGQLESICRFVKLHSWKVTMRVPDTQRKIIDSYAIGFLDKMENQIADSPLAELDYYTGILPHNRRFVDGLPRRMALNEVAVVRDKIEEPTEGVFTDGQLYFLRFKEPGWYQVTFNKPVSRRNKIISTKVTVEVVRTEGSTDMVFGSGTRESYFIVKQEGVRRLIQTGRPYIPPEYEITQESVTLLGTPQRSNVRFKKKDIELDNILDE